MTAPSSFPKANILVVDDEPGSLKALVHLLEGPDRIVVAAHSGPEALRRILKSDFALILMDVRMPGMDGFETAGLIRKVRRSRHTPIIFLTAAGDSEKVVHRGYEAGAVDYIVKPADADILKSKVAVFVGLNNQSADLESEIRERSASLIQANERLRREIEMREHAEADLRNAKQAAEAASLAKSEFLANMSHEIRTPMNAILGITDLALQTDLSADQREYLGLLKASSESLCSIVNDILDFSKIEAGRLDIEIIPFSLRESIGDTVKALAIGARLKGLSLDCSIAPETPDSLLGDPVRLRQIVFNIVGNAIKFTEQGSILLRIHPEAVEGAELACYFSVRDTGIGIPQEKQAAIFSPFLQADSSTTRLYGGTGLGLTISARLVELMRGRIWLDSMPGEGSTFHFTLRLGLQDARNGGRTPPDADAAKERPARPLEVLLIEDNALNRRLAQLAIEKAGHRVLPLDNGAAGLDALARGRFDLVLMDVQMPRMDGIETTRRIREAEKSRGGHVQVIALTAHAMTRDRERCLQAGMDGYLVKPIQAASLIEAVERFHRSASPAQRRVDADALDRSALLERISGDGKLLGEITELFMHEAGRLIRDIRAAIEARDAAEFARCVHTLRGMLRSLSADSAAQLAETLQSLDPASDQQRTAEACEKLVQALAGVKADLRGLAGEVGLSEAAQG